MENKTIVVQVLAVRRMNSKTPESYRELELLSVVDENDKRFEISRFRRDNDIPLRETHFYKGTQKKNTKINPNTDLPYNDTFEDVVPMTGFEKDNGIDTPFDEVREGEKDIDPADERQVKYNVWGDIHTAAPIVAKHWKVDVHISEEDNKRELVKSLIHIAKICRQARLELNQEYIDEFIEEKSKEK